MKLGCTGHQNLSPSTRRDVAAVISTMLTDNASEELVGVTSLAQGSDQIFALAILAAGGQLHVIVPSEGYERSFTCEQARDAYVALLSLAADATTLPFDAPSQDAYLAAGHEVADGCDTLIAVWDGQDAAGKGGTADVVRYARHRGIDVRIVWPIGAHRS